MRFTAQPQNPLKRKLLLGERKWLVIEFTHFPAIITSKIPRWAVTPEGWEKERTAVGQGTFWGLLPVCINHCPTTLPSPLCRGSPESPWFNTQYSLNDKIQLTATLWLRSKWYASSFIDGLWLYPGLRTPPRLMDIWGPRWKPWPILSVGFEKFGLEGMCSSTSLLRRQKEDAAPLATWSQFLQSSDLRH